VALEQFPNFARTTLDANINNSTTSITVVNGTRFSAPGRVVIGSEIMRLTAVVGNTLTVTRGQEGTTGASHNLGDVIIQTITKAGLDQWLSDARLSDTFANLPAAGVAGRSQIITDGCSIAIDDGANWNHFGPFFPNLTPPVDAQFSWVNQGGASVSTARGGVILTAPAGAGYSMRLRYKALTAPYKVTMHFMPNLPNNNYMICGLGLRSSASGKCEEIHLANASNRQALEVGKNTNETAYSSTPASIFADNAGHWIRWFQVEDDNTNIYFRYSNNGKMWITLFSEARGTFFSGGSTPTGAFFYANTNGGSKDAQMHVKHWLEQ